MRPVSRRFLAAAASSHTMVARATYLTTFQTGTTPVGTRLPIIDGNVKLSTSGKARASIDVTVAWPWDNPALPLLPYGDELYVERGIDYGDGTREWVGLGYFRVDTVEQKSAPYGSLRLTGPDRMAQLVDDRLEAPVQYLAGQTLADPIVDLVLAVYPGLTILADFTPGQIRLNSNQVSDEKRYEFLDDLITAQGRIWYFDYAGRLVIKAVPGPDVPVWTIKAGPGGLLTGSSRERTRKGVFNAVVAYGQTSDTTPPCRAVVRDMNEQSPTYWNGKFGHVPRFYSSSFLQSDDQCRIAAAGILAKAVGLPYAVDFDGIVAPFLEPWDPIAVGAGVRQDTRTYIIDDLTIPLTRDKAMSGSVRDQSNVTIEGQ